MMPIQAFSACIKAFNLRCRIENGCRKQVENHYFGRHRTRFICRRSHAAAKQERQYEKAQQSVSEDDPNCPTHPLRTSAQCGAPDISSFEIPSDSIHDEDHWQKNKKVPRSKKLQEMVKYVCGAQKRGHVDGGHCYEANYGHHEARVDQYGHRSALYITSNWREIPISLLEGGKAVVSQFQLAGHDARDDTEWDILLAVIAPPLWITGH